MHHISLDEGTTVQPISFLLFFLLHSYFAHGMYHILCGSLEMLLRPWEAGDPEHCTKSGLALATLTTQHCLGTPALPEKTAAAGGLIPPLSLAARLCRPSHSRNPETTDTGLLETQVPAG